MNSISAAHLRRFPEAGFTLIELLVTLAIMVLLVGGAVAAYVNYDNQQKVFQAGSNFASVVRTAQKRATVGDKTSACPGKLMGYEVKANANAQSYTMAMVCDVAGVQGPYGTVTYALPSSTMSFQSGVSISFAALSGGFPYTISSASQDVCIGDSNSSNYYKMTIYRTGAIQTPTAVAANCL